MYITENGKDQSFSIGFHNLTSEGKLIADYPRLNATTITEFINMWEERVPILFEEFNLKVLNCDIRSRLLFHERVSNSHTCPLNGVTNWSGNDKNKPNYYIGWQGWITANILYDKTFKPSSYNIYSLFRMCTGTFNGGPHSSGEVRLYLDDCPKIKERISDNLIEGKNSKDQATSSLCAELLNPIIYYGN